MASNIDDNDLVKCPICFEQFTNPKYLPCLHTFCQLCLKSYIISQLGGEGQKSKPFPCPVCRQSVQVPEPNVSSEKIADAMPGNHLITSLIERSQAANKDDDRRTCDPCKNENQNSPAEVWCTVCLEALCENCASCHKRLKPSKSHATVPISDASKEQPVKLLDVEEPCVEHSGKVLEVYCLDHKQMCCVICLATSHRRCDNISTFEEMIKGAKDGESVKDFTKRLLEVDEKTDILRTNTEENISSLDLKQAEIAENVSTIVQAAIDKLQTQKNKFSLQLKQIHKEQNVLLTEKKERIEAFQSSVKRGYKLMTAVCEQGSPKQVFITKEKLKAQLKNHMERLKQDLTNSKGVEYLLHVDGTLSAVKDTLTSVAKVELKSSVDVSASLNALMCAFDDSHLNDVDIMDLEVVKVCNIVVGAAEITGGAFVPGGKIVFCDYTYDKLKLYGKTGNHLSDTPLNDSPWDVTGLSNDEIVVSFENQSSLKRYEITQDTFKEVCQIPCKSGRKGLAFINGNIIVGYDGCIDVMTIEGRCLNSIQRSSSYPYVATFKSGHIFHGDGNSIVCRSVDGRELFRYSDPKLQSPAGIALDCNGNVFVCGDGSGNVHIVSRDGKRGKLVMSDLKSPFAIGFDNDCKRFFLATISPSPSLNIYQLSVKKKTSKLIYWKIRIRTCIVFH